MIAVFFLNITITYYLTANINYICQNKIKIRSGDIHEEETYLTKLLLLIF